MTLQEIYLAKKKEPAPPALFIMELMNVSEKKSSAVRGWLSGRSMPDRLTRKVLAEHFNTSEKELFSYIKPAKK